MSDVVGNPEDRFSHNEAHIILSCVVRNPAACICEKEKRRLAALWPMLVSPFSFHCIDSFFIQNFKPIAIFCVLQPGLCVTCWETKRLFFCDSAHLRVS